MDEWKESKFGIIIEDAFGTASRWALFWAIVVRRRNLELKISLSPPETEVRIAYIYCEVQK